MAYCLVNTNSSNIKTTLKHSKKTDTCFLQAIYIINNSKKIRLKKTTNFKKQKKNV